MAQNNVPVETILGQIFYSEKHQVYGRWLCGDGRISIYFVYDGTPHRIPFEAIITEELLPWAKEAAALLMEAKLDELEYHRRKKLCVSILWIS